MHAAALLRKARPAWQRRGTGLYWRTFENRGLNPKTGVETTAQRRGIHRDKELPHGEDYARLLKGLMQAANAAGASSG